MLQQAALQGNQAQMLEFLKILEKWQTLGQNGINPAMLLAQAQNQQLQQNQN